jgi:hypothetical protein
MQIRRHAALSGVVAALTLSTVAHADTAEEVKAVRTVGVVIHDGKGHYVAFGEAEPDKTDLLNNVVYYGDGKTFYRQHIKAAGTQVNDAVQWAMLDERMGLELGRSSVTFQKGAWVAQCRDTKTPMQVLDPKDARTLLAKAVFKPMGMDRQALVLGRDGTTYYYADQARDEHATKTYRLFVGKRGALKEQPVKSAAVDAAGGVLTSKAGALRFTWKTPSVAWEPKPGKSVALSEVPIESNLELVYAELGVYNRRFGVPCDDL